MAFLERWRWTIIPVLLAVAMTMTRGSAIASERESKKAEPIALPADDLRPRLEKALDRWCRWLAGYLYQVPESDLYTMAPTLGTGRNPYRDIAGNQFAAAAAGYWLARTKPDENTARALEGLIKLALGTHVAVKTIDRSDVQKWGAGFSGADDWHASLFAAVAGMLMPEALSPEQRDQLRTILAWEADKHAGFGIDKKWRNVPGRSPEGSCGESNAWTTAALQAARLAMPASDRQAIWREAAVAYSLNAICLPGDITSDRVVGGKPLKDRVKGANFEPGGIQEHHGFYHPGYMGWPLAYAAFAALLDQALPDSQRNSDVFLNNWKQVFDRLKQSTFANGRFIHCAGDDWNVYGYGNAKILPIAVFAAGRFRDPDAMRLAQQWLSLIEQQQALAGGSVQGSRLATLQRLRVNDFAWYEAIEGCCLAEALWVLDRINAKAIPAASTEQEYNARNAGTYHEPNARLVWHRDEDRWASFSWRSAYGQWQAIVQPIRLPHLLKFNYNGTGILDAVGTESGAKIQSFAIDTLKGGGFWSLGTIDREAKSSVNGRVFPLVRQHQALVVLPDGPSILIDLCQALDQLWLRRSGGMGMRLAADVFNDNKVTLEVNGSERVFGQHPERDTWLDLGARSLRIEKQMVVHAIAGEGTFQLLQKRRRSPDRSQMLYEPDAVGAEESLLAHELYFGPPAYDRPRIVPPGAWFREMVLVTHCDLNRAPSDPVGTVTGRYPCLTVHLPGAKCAVAVNFADTEQTVAMPSPLRVPPRTVRLGS